MPPPVDVSASDPAAVRMYVDASFQHSAQALDLCLSRRDVDGFYAAWSHAFERGLVWAKGEGAKCKCRGKPK
eukprot:4424650-Alexandrium_andersonii.AAC.1